METKAVSLAHEEYAQTMHIIAHEDMQSQKSDEATNFGVRALYMSLLGAVAYVLLTRGDISIFCVSPAALVAHTAGYTFQAA